MRAHWTSASLTALLIAGCAPAPPAGLNHAEAIVTIHLDKGVGAAIQPTGIPTDRTDGTPGITEAELFVSTNGQALAFDASGNLTDGEGVSVMLNGGSTILRLPQGTYDFLVGARDDDDNQLADGHATGVPITGDTTIPIELVSFVADATLIAPQTIIPNQVLDIPLWVHPPGRPDLIVPTSDYTAGFTATTTILSSSARGARLVIACEATTITANVTDHRGGPSIERSVTLPISSLCDSYAGGIGVDLIPPYLELDATPETVPVGTTVTLTGTVNDAQSGVASVDLYDGPIHLGTATIDDQTTPHTYAFTFIPNEERAYALTLVARDHAGNEARAQSTVAAVANSTPPTTYATRAGGTGSDVVRGVSALRDGGSIVTGAFEETATFGATTLTSAGGYDAYVAKSHPDGTWAWSRSAGGTEVVVARGVSTLSDGSAIIAGYFQGTANFAATTLISAGEYDLFVAKTNPDGTWAWATRAGGLGYDVGFGVSTLDDGSAIVTGHFEGTASFGATTLNSEAYSDSFVAKIDADGSWSWATSAGGTSADVANGVSALSDGSAIITGHIQGTTTFGATILTSDGSLNVFVAKTNPDGTWAWATRAGGTSTDVAYGVSTLEDGSAIVTGSILGTATFGATTLTSDSSSRDVFVAKTNPDGTWDWATSAGGTGFDRGYGVSTLDDGSAIITGSFQGTASFGATVLISAGLADAFVARTNPSGAWDHATSSGGTENDLAWAASTLSDGSAIIGGEFRSTVAFGATTLASAGAADVFVVKLSASGTW